MKYEVPYCAKTGNETVWRFNRDVVDAFAEGCGGKTFDMEFENKNFFPEKVATYGILRRCDKIIKEAKEYWYMDRGYFSPKNYIRITRNNIIHDGLGDFKWDRFNKFNLKLSPWNLTGGNIVIVPPSGAFSYLLDHENWTKLTIEKVIKYTDRDIIISRKPGAKISNEEHSLLTSTKQVKELNAPLKEALKDAWVLITDISNTMVDAAINGIPIICTNNNRRIGSIEEIESPIKDRNFLKNLAYNQWTFEEMRSGKAWQELNEWG